MADDAGDGADGDPDASADPVGLPHRLAREDDPYREERLAILDDPLTRRLGAPVVGDLIALTADPDSNAELVGLAAGRRRPTRYLSTVRAAEEVERSAAALADPATIDVRRVRSDALLEDPAEGLSGLDRASVVVVDPATALERADRDRYARFLDRLKRHLRTTESVGVLHCPRMSPRALRRDHTLVRADVVWDLRSGVDGEAQAAAIVRKDRRGRAPRGPVPVRLAPDAGMALADRDRS